VKTTLKKSGQKKERSGNMRAIRRGQTPALNNSQMLGATIGGKADEEGIARIQEAPNIRDCDFVSHVQKAGRKMLIARDAIFIYFPGFFRGDKEVKARSGRCRVRAAQNKEQTGPRARQLGDLKRGSHGAGK